jgi:hypothetical protein
MKTKFHCLFFLLVLLASSTLDSQFSTALAQGTAFTYQGRLNNGTNSANGNYEFEFILYPTNQSGFPVGPVPTPAAVVSNGLFIVTLDFGDIFTGSNYWLDIYVRTNGASSFTELSPRQPLTPTPYAIMAESVPGLTVQQNTNGSPNVIGGSSANYVSNGVVGATIGGGGAVYYDGASYTNSVTAIFGTVGGGGGNTASGWWGVVGGGAENTASGFEATVGGGAFNIASGLTATVGGGFENNASNYVATVGGGIENIASSGGTVGGGGGNIAGGFYATVGGGNSNTASGQDATVPGGYLNIAGGDSSFAAGTMAHAGHDGSFVWADDSGFTFSSTTANQFRVRATGGVAFATAIDSSGNVTAGVHLLAGDTAWSSISDKNAKKNFQPVDGKAVLEKLAAIPVEKWNYKWEQDNDVPNVGPMAQDFKHAFYPGRDDKGISTLEFDGVELAAIQGLNEKVEARSHNAEVSIRKLEAENAELKQSVAELKAMVNQLAAQK